MHAVPKISLNVFRETSEAYTQEKWINLRSFIGRLPGKITLGWPTWFQYDWRELLKNE